MGAQEVQKTSPQNTPDETTFIFSDEPAPVQETEGTISPFGMWDFLRMLLILGFVLALVYGFFHYLKKLSAPRETGLEVIRILESRGIPGNKQLHLVELGGHLLLIGTAENTIQLLLELKDQETIDEIRLKVSELPSGRHPGRFADLVRQYFHRKPERKSDEGIGSSGKNRATEEESLEFIRRQRERLNRLH